MNTVLASSSSFSDDWLREGDKRVVPLRFHSLIDGHLAERVSDGARWTGHTHVIACRLRGVAGDPREFDIPANRDSLLDRLPWSDESFLVALPDLAGALLVTDEGYSLIAGTDDFIRHSVPEGADQAIIAFKRYAKRAGHNHPALAEVSKGFQPRQTAWASLRDVSPGSATAEQASLMKSFVSGEIEAEEFAKSWLAARRRSLEHHERLRDPFSRIFDQVFYALDDYVIDPALRDEDDMTNEQLREIVGEHLIAVNSLDPTSR